MAAQDAELKLKVSLDLAFFRQQLAGLGQATAGTPLKVQVQFDRRSVQNELNALGSNIRRRNYRLEVNTNLKAEIENAKKLAEALNALPKGGGAQRSRGTIDKGFTQVALKGLGADIKTLYKALGDAGLIEFNDAIAKNKEKIAKELSAIGQDTIKGLLNGIASGNPQIKAAAASLGTDLIASIKSVLGIASPSKETGKLGKFAAEGFGKGFVSGMVQVERQMANAIRSAVIGALQEGLGKLPGLGGALVSFERQLATGIQLSVRKAMREGLSASIVPGIKGVGLGGLGGGATGAALGGSKALAGAATAGMVKLGAGGMMGVAGQMGKLAIGDTSGLTNFIQESVSQAINAALSTGGQGALTGALAVGGVAGAVGFGGGFAKSLVSEVATAVRNRVLAVLLTATDSDVRGIVQVAVRDITNAVFSGILRQVRGSIANLPSLDWASTIPQRGISSNAFNRTLTGASAPTGLPGTAFGAQKYLPTTLTNDLKQVLNEAANAFVDSLRQNVRKVEIRDLGPAVSRQPLLGAGGMATRLLPPAGGTTPAGQMRFNAVTTGASVGQPQFMRAPAIPSAIGGGAGGMQPPGGGGGGGGGGLGGFGRAFASVPNLPGSGVIRELGNEFAFAAKQVVLFGQAYKLLAFIQDFPAQIGAAVGQLQSFRNTLGAISPTAEEARASNELILDLMERYNVPLQAARDGFTKLYASMAPAGFSGDEIRDLFTGITQAAATFGLSADKVDRVNYAFAQMASKGQVMSEELKGQLGDVLPGAMAIFAEAAGFEGPKAIQDFSAALEEGQYKGEAMVQLLKNVGVVFQKEFGPGAEGAAKTFQGIINRLQNSLVLLYESFEPAAVTFLNAVVLPLTNGIKQVSDGLNAFFTGAAAKTAGGFGIAQELEKLRPAFAGIAQNVQQLIPVFQQFANVALGLGRVFLEIAGNPFTGYLLRAYVAVLPLTLAIQALNLKALIPLIASFLRAIPAFVAYTAATVQGTTANKALQLAMVVTGRTAGVTATQIRSVGLALKAAFASTVFGAVLLGIGVLIEKIISLNASMADTRAKALGAAQAIRSMSQTEAQQATRQYEAGAQSLRGLNEQIEQGRLKGKAWIQVTEQQAKALQDAGIIVSNVRGSLQVQPTRVAGAFQKLEGLAAEGRYRQRQIASEEQQAMEITALPAIPGSEGEGAGAKTKELDKYNQSQLDFIQQRFTKEKQLLDQQLQSNLLSKTSYDIKLAELTLETKKAELQERFRIESEKINKANFSAADKALALKDEEVKLENALAIATKERDIAIKGAKLELRKPFVDALRGENLEIDKQTALLDRLKQGYSGLSIEQEASFIIEERIANLRADEQRLIQTDIDNLKQQIRLRLENVKALQQQAALTEAQRELGVIGTGLRAGFTGSAANVFERALIESEGNVDYASKLAEIETAAMRARSVFEGLQGSIEGISGAFANILTEGVASLIAGTSTAKEVFASFLQSVAQTLQQAAQQIIATYVAIGIAKIFAGLGSAASVSATGPNPGGIPSTGNVTAPSVNGLDLGAAANLAANGAYFNSGMSYFATGGIVSSPSFFQFADGGKINMGMMGEAGPEAIMPLKRGADGKLGVQVADNRAALNAASNAAAEGSSDAFGDENEMDAAGRAAIREIERIKENKNSLTSNSERSIMKQMLDSERDRISESRSEVNSQQLTSEISLMRERMLENRMQLESQRSAVERSYETERLRENRMELMSQQYESERRFERERIEKMASTSQKLDINYTSQVINNVEYVTREQAEQLAAQSALRGRELALGSLQNSVKARKRVGIA